VLGSQKHPHRKAEQMHLNRSICESTGSLDRQSAKTTLGGGGIRGDCGIGGGRSAWTRATRFSKCPTVLRSCA
jgi:hypothetical protein